MGLKEWADNQERKRDIRQAIIETQLHTTHLTALLVTSKALPIDQKVQQTFLESIQSALQDSEARLWRFKGPSREWTGSTSMMVLSGRLEYSETREKLYSVATCMSFLRGGITQLLEDLKSGRHTSEEIHTLTSSQIDSNLDTFITHMKELTAEALSSGSVTLKFLERVERNSYRQLERTMAISR